MRVGIVCPYDLGHPGGVQQVVLGLARSLASLGDDVVVAGPGKTSESDGYRYQPVGRSLSVNANGSKAPVALSPATWTRTKRALGDVEIVHVHEPLIPLVGWAALSISSSPKVVTFHADPPRWARAIYSTASPLVARAMRDVVTTATSAVAASAVPESWGSPLVIPNGIDVGSFMSDVERLPQRVAFLGRDEPRKGLDVLLGAWPAIVAAHPDAELVVMGASRDMEQVGVRYLGRVSGEEKRRVLSSSSVFVAPNLRGESFGIVVAEAMAAGCAVVASDLPAFAAVLGGSGRLVPGGQTSRFADAIIGLLSDHDEARSLGQGARSAARRFDWPVVTDGYRAAYARALAM